MSLKEFQIIRKLGQGVYSSVYQVFRIKDQTTYALKKVNLSILSLKERQNALNEVRILASLNHPNIIAYKDSFVDETTKSLCIVMEYANDGDLQHKIKQNKINNQPFAQAFIWEVLIQVVKGLKSLHDIGALHRDIKPANIFLHRNGTVKIGDMNVSKVMEGDLCLTKAGTPYYASPQVWKDQPYDSKSDIWSLGCVIYEMATLKLPFQGEDLDNLYKKVVRGIYQRISTNYSNELSDIIRQLLQINPNSRPSYDKILRKPAIQKRLYQEDFEDNYEKKQLFGRIKDSENIGDINIYLPPSHYHQNIAKKFKALLNSKCKKAKINDYNCLSGIDRSQQSLPTLDKQSKNKYSQILKNLSKQKLSPIMGDMQNKKRSQTQECDGDNINTLIGKSVIRKIEQLTKPIKLPKVNRYRQGSKYPLSQSRSIKKYKIS